MKKLWDKERNRLGEFGLDLRGGRLHHWAGKLAIWIDNHFVTVKVIQVTRKGKTFPYTQATRLGRISANLSCACEACIRELLPWPFSW